MKHIFFISLTGWCFLSPDIRAEEDDFTIDELIGLLAATEDHTVSVSVWDTNYNLRSSLGFKDNVLLGSKDPVERAYALLGFDLAAFRVSEREHEFYSFLSAEHERYNNPDPVDSESFAWAMAEYRHRAKKSLWLGIGAEFLYLDQVLDLSMDEDLTIVQASGHLVGVIPSIEKEIADLWTVGFRVPLQRQYYNKPLDDYKETAPELILKRKVNKESEWRFKAHWEYRDYDSRLAHTETTISDPYEGLIFERAGLEARYRSFLDDARRWRTTTTLGWLQNEDNGDGYYNYDRLILKQELIYKRKPLQIKSSLGFRDYRYAKQLDDNADQRRRKRTIRAELRGSYELREQLKLFFSYGLERSQSNSSFDDYRANTFSVGLDWEF